MKSFFGGLVITLMVGLWFQNQVQSARLTALEYQIKYADELKKKKSSSTKSNVKKSGRQLAYWEVPHPDCPKHLPYMAGHWGCVVRPIDPN